VGEDGFSLGNSATAKVKCNNMIAAFKSNNVKPTQDWTLVARNTSGGWEFGLANDAITYADIKAQEGKIVRNKCPVSSSLNTKNTSFSGKKVRIYYKLPPGFRGIFAGNHSAHPGENEWILPPGMAYKISEVKEQPNGRIDVMAEVVNVKLPESV
jgi:hypothetical protein